MKLLVSLLAGVLLVALVASDSAVADQKTKDPIEAFQGEWAVVSCGFGNYEFKGTAQQPMKWSFTKDRVVMRPAFEISSQAGFTIGREGFKGTSSTILTLSTQHREITFRLDPAKTPAQIDLEEKDGEKAAVWKGIYQLTQDELELCFPFPKGWNRPKQFGANSTTLLVRLKRMPPKE